MTDSGWDRAKQLFQEALEHAPEARAEFLARVCHGKLELRARVEALLDAHDNAEGFLGGEASVDAGATGGVAAGDRIGPYKLLQEIGAGGFGTVFMAEQTEPVRRTVALKVIKLGMDTKQVIARFEAERQALAMMDHANIAKVLDAGATPNGRPYFVMELVKGIPITEYCDQANLATTERLDLFVKVCAAVQHAHQKGVIHRDLKPSNILVTLHDGSPVPKVIDFGVAKATDHRLTEKTLFTEFRQIIGTPEYMSPEQAELSGLDVDTRSDIYSLGVLLYELLTGTKPFDMREILERGLDEMLRVIREVDPPKPSTRISTMGEALTGIAKHRRTAPRLLGRVVRGDLDWIVMKALEKDRTRRYETATEFAGDIGRYLMDEPIRARPPSATYRLRKFVRRHRAGVFTSVVVAVALVAGLAVAAFGWAEAKRQEHVAEERASEAQTEATRSGAIVEFFRTMLSASDPHQSNGPGYTVRELLDEFDGRIGDAPRAEPAVEATVRQAMADSYRRLGLLEPAKRHQEKAIALFTAAHGPDDRRTRESRLSNAWLVHDRGEYPEASKQLRTLLTVTPEPAIRIWIHHALADMASHQARLEEVERELATATALLDDPDVDAGDARSKIARMRADALENVGDHGRAEPLYRKALALQRRRWGGKHMEVATTLNNLGLCLFRKGDLDAAEAVLRESIAMERTITGTPGPVALGNLGDVLVARGRFDEAARMITAGLEIMRRRYGQSHPVLSRMLTSMGSLEKRRGNPAAAERYFREALDADRVLLGDNPEIAHRLVNLAESLFDQGRYAEERPLLEEAIAIFKRHEGAEGQSLANALNSTAAVWKALGKTDEALECAREALRIARLHPSAQRLLGTCLGQLGLIHRDRREFEAAEAPLAEALAVRLRQYGEKDFFTLLAYNNVGLVQTDLGRYEQALDSYQKAEAIARRLFGGDHPTIALTSHNIANLKWELGEWEEALRIQRESVRVKRLMGRHPELAGQLIQLARFSSGTGDAEGAERTYREALAMARDLLPPDHPLTIQWSLEVGEFLTGIRPPDGRALLREVRDLWAKRLGPKAEPTLRAASEAAWALVGMGRADEGEAELNAAAAAWRDAHGPASDGTLRTLSRICQLRLSRNAFAEAEAPLLEIVAAHRAAGRRDGETGSALAMLGMCLLEQKKFAEAEPVLRQCLEIRRPAADWLAFNAMSLLGGSLLGQKKYAAAEPLLLEAWEKIDPPEPLAFRKTEALDRIVALYEQSGRPDDARKWRERKK